MEIASNNRLPADRFQGLFEANKWLLLLIIGMAYTAVYVLSEKLLPWEEINYTTYAEKATISQIAELNESEKQYSWVAYLLQFVQLLVRVFFVAICLNIGTIFSNLKISFGQLLQVAIVCELVLLAHFTLINILLIATVDETTTRVGVATFQPFSLLGLLDVLGVRKVPVYFLYPLQVISIFEVLHWLSLGLGIQYLTRKTYGKSVKLVFSSYVVGLIIWVVTIVFIMVLIKNSYAGG